LSRIELPEGIELDDPRPIAASAPYTFFMPHPEEIAALKSGDGAKFIFRQEDAPDGCAVERMWVLIEHIEDGWLHAKLDNDPYDMDKFNSGDAVVLPLSHVVSTTFSDENPRPTTLTAREYWERCLADACVLNGRSHVDYIYRETPDMGSNDDTYPDSGWRIRGTDEGIADDKRRGEEPAYIALGKVLNQDDRWLHLIDREVGVAFQWNPSSDDYIELE
jgi:hypothetical protein